MGVIGTLAGGKATRPRLGGSRSGGPLTGRPVLATASLLFFLSGASGLVYEVLWFRRFAHQFGSSSLALAAVVSAFLLGLGLGARWLGPFADRVRSPLRVYAWFEVGIAFLALLVPYELAALGAFSATIYPALADQPLLHTALRLVLAAVALGPPCILMGGTLPLLVRRFTTADRQLVRSTAWLYAINTLGAATGAFAAGFFLLPLTGLVGTRWVAVFINLGVAAVAFLLDRGGAPSTSESDPAAPPPSTSTNPAPRARALTIAAAATGLGALILQMVWARQLAMVLGGTTYAFSAVLCMVLVGIGAGSLAAHRIARRSETIPRALVLVVAGLALTTLLGQLAIPTLSRVVGELRFLRSSPVVNALLCGGASAAVELLPSVAAGIIFPLLVHRRGTAGGGAGDAVGRIYAANIVGAVLGAVATLFLVPALGTTTSVLLGVACYGAVPVLLLPREWWTRHRVTALTLAGALLAVPLGLRPSDPLVTSAGMYVYGAHVPNLEGSRVLFHREGRACDVLVSANDVGASLRVNGKIDASTFPSDQVTQLGCAYLPRCLRPDARDVLVIGYGSGATAGASLLFPETNVTCVEIEEAVVEASPFFAAINHSPETSPRFRVVIEDGRSHLAGTGERYDIIATEPSNPWIAGVGNLFTREFYETARDHLTEGGVLAQWMHTYGIGVAEYGLLARTLRDVFPHVAIARLSHGDTLLLASERPLAPDAATADAAQRLVDGLPAVRQDLEVYLGSADVRTLMLRYLVWGEDAVDRIAGFGDGDTIHTDVNMRLEFDAPRHVFGGAAHGALDRQLLAVADAAWVQRLARTMASGAPQADALLAVVAMFRDRGRADLVGPLVELALELAPDHAAFLSERLVLTVTDADTGPRFDDTLSRLLAVSEAGAARAARELSRLGAWERSAQVLQALVDRRPSSATSWAQLATALHHSGRAVAARDALATAQRLDPLAAAVHDAARLLGID